MGESALSRAWVVKEGPYAMQERLAGAVIGGANRHVSIENRKTAACGPVKFRIQVGICGEQALYDIAVECIELAWGASRGRGRIRSAREQTDFADVVAGPDKAKRLLAGKFGLLADLKNSGDDDEERRFSSPLREQHLSRFERSRIYVGGQFGQLRRLPSFEKDHVLKKREHCVK